MRGDDGVDDEVSVPTEDAVCESCCLSCWICICGGSDVGGPGGLGLGFRRDSLLLIGGQFSSHSQFINCTAFHRIDASFSSNAYSMSVHACVSALETGGRTKQPTVTLSINESMSLDSNGSDPRMLT